MGAPYEASAIAAADDDSSQTIHLPSDLLPACVAHLAFLRRLHRLGVTTLGKTEPQWRRDAIQRYLHRWLPLLAANGEGKNGHTGQSTSVVLIPPPDVAWVWHCHRLAPFAYRDFCRQRFGRILSPCNAQVAFAFQDPQPHRPGTPTRQAWVTQLLWEKRYPNDSFYLNQITCSARNSSPTKQSTDECQYADAGTDSSTYKLLVASLDVQASFLWHLSSGPQWDDEDFALQAIRRYQTFLSLVRMDNPRKLHLVPTYDIDWVWHSHIAMNTANYLETTNLICGQPLNHDDTFHNRGGSAYQDAWKRTCELFRQETGQDYDAVPGTLYYGEPLNIYWEYTRWDPTRPWKKEKRARKNRFPKILLPSSSSSVPTWREIHGARGPDLWRLRQVLVNLHTDKRRSQQHSKQYMNCIPIQISNAPVSWLSKIEWRRRRPKPILLVGSASTFLTLESKKGMDKVAAFADDVPKALTQLTGLEWKHQRKILTHHALSSVKEMSLAAVKQVNWETLWQSEAEQCGFTHCKSGRVMVIVDLKDMLVSAVLTWVSYLFGGTSDIAKEHNQQLATAFKEYWMHSRAIHRDSKGVSTSRHKLELAIHAVAESQREQPTMDGLISQVFSQDKDLSPAQATVNCVHALVAASDTTFCLLFWTILNLSQTPDAWRKCRSIDWATSELNLQDELRQLGYVKAQATTGEVVNTSSLSFMGRALMETARVFPPVWTLPRVLEDGTYVKLDVPWTNRALQRNWNPDSPLSLPLATFGVGQRHCPGGTAALFAAHHMLRYFVTYFEAPKECSPGHALQSLYLGPTLCLEGPQYFQVTVAAM